MELEKLLNKLIEKGREPFGNYRDIITRYKYDERFFEFNHEGDNMVSIRELVSKESGLWQFVCENGMVDDGVEYKGYALVDVDGGAIAKYETGCRYLYSNIEPEFYIMESALCNEEDLEKFLLDNIKV